MTTISSPSSSVQLMASSASSDQQLSSKIDGFFVSQVETAAKMERDDKANRRYLREIRAQLVEKKAEQQRSAALGSLLGAVVGGTLSLAASAVQIGGAAATLKGYKDANPKTRAAEEIKAARDTKAASLAKEDVDADAELKACQKAEVQIKADVKAAGKDGDAPSPKLLEAEANTLKAMERSQAAKKALRAEEIDAQADSAQSAGTDTEYRKQVAEIESAGQKWMGRAGILNASGQLLKGGGDYAAATMNADVTMTDGALNTFDSDDQSRVKFVEEQQDKRRSALAAQGTYISNLHSARMTLAQNV